MTIRLKPEVKERWLAALRSGDYQQGMGALVQQSLDGTKRYCCLGVLCDLSIVDGVGQWGEMKSADADFICTDGSESAASLPSAVASWAFAVADDEDEAWRNDPRVVTDDGTYRRTLSAINDDGDHTFADIADMIEASL